MFIHIVPRILATEPCTLLDVAIKEFDLTLIGGAELAVCQIYRNRQYLVACRLATEWGAEGILINTPHAPREFTVVTRWAVEGKHTAIHSVRYVVPADYDDEHDMLSSDVPRMFVKPLTDPRVQELIQLRVDMKLQEWPNEVLNDQGYITERSEVVVLHRSPRQRYFGNPKFNKLPMLKDMFDLVANSGAADLVDEPTGNP